MTEKHQRIADAIHEAYQKILDCDSHEWEFDKKRRLYYCKKCRACKNPLQYALQLKEGEKQ